MRPSVMLVVSLTALWGARAAAQDSAASARPRWGTTTMGQTIQPSEFRFEPAAKSALQRMWQESEAAKQERVACLGGRVEHDTVVVERVQELEPEDADSMGISASRSIAECGPPAFGGTVHTHIALYDGEHPYPSFSGADRGVMNLWWRRWQGDGMFCVLYDRSRAHCEVLTGGTMLMHHGMPYAEDPGRPPVRSSD